jgi:hypothetical protein
MSAPACQGNRDAAVHLAAAAHDQRYFALEIVHVSAVP